MVLVRIGFVWHALVIGLKDSLAAGRNSIQYEFLLGDSKGQRQHLDSMPRSAKWPSVVPSFVGSASCYSEPVI